MVQEERVRARAYEIWDREGRQEGEHEAHWQQAQAELEREAAIEGQQETDNDPARNGSFDSAVSGGANAEAP